MDIRSGYKNDEVLRKSLTSLAEDTFGIDLERWYNKGFWQGDYIPYSVVEKGNVISNVSVNVCNIRWRGRIRHLAQLGTVMTHPLYRGKGHMNTLMNIVTDYCDRSFEGTYLYAKRDMKEFYESFGFTERVEWQCSKEVNITSKASATNILMDSNEECSRMVDIIQRREQYGDKIMVNNPGLFMFHLTGPLSDCVYCLPEEDTYVVARVTESELMIYAAFSDAKVSLGDVISSFGKDIRRVTLEFSPENTTGFEQKKIEDEDSILLVKGDIFEQTRNEKFMFPRISMA